MLPYFYLLKQLMYTIRLDKKVHRSMLTMIFESLDENFQKNSHFSIFKIRMLIRCDFGSDNVCLRYKTFKKVLIFIWKTQNVQKVYCIIYCFTLWHIYDVFCSSYRYYQCKLKRSFHQNITTKKKVSCFHPKSEFSVLGIYYTYP